MANRLAGATSPYLLQHQDNPVDWHEWGEPAFEEARARDLPILLSVGYSACHWCHVMAHESFEDPDTAALMNRLFINVKVDREERPDVDAVYMEAVQAMTGRGGWPMTVWLDHEGRPFYAGTYFPDRPRHGMPAFTEVMEAVAEAWAGRRHQVDEQAERLAAVIDRGIPKSERLPGPEALSRAYDSLSTEFDPILGGFGRAPKFPQQTVLEFLLRIRTEPWAKVADPMLSTTLLRMADGGIHDHLGGGFARYSVDSRWLVPHFEKMLYDNAQLARIYLWAGIELGEPRLITVARSTLDYLAGDLRHPEGGFYSAEDADSEGEEGRFYVWDRAELDLVLGEADAAVAAHFFGATAEGNFEGSNVLHRPTGEPWDDRIEAIRRRLLLRRAHRVRPGLDDKVVAAWNGLAIRAFAEAGAALGEPRYLETALTCARFVTANLLEGGKVMRSWREGRAHVPGFLEDHAGLALGLLALYAANGDTKWFSTAAGLMDRVMAVFADPEGGFFDTAEDAERLVKRPKGQIDNPTPSGSAMAAEALLTLASYTGDGDTRERMEDALRAAGVLMERFPSMVAHHLSVLHSSLRARELAVVGPGWEELARVHWLRFRPHVALAGGTEGSDTVPLLTGRTHQGRPRAYVCQDLVCNLPTEDPETLAAQLG